MLLLCALSLAATHLVLVRSMQRLPTILAIAAGLFVSLCVFEAMAHGINPTLEWDLHPPWWQSDVLAHIGWVFAVPSVLLLRFVRSRRPGFFAFRSFSPSLRFRRSYFSSHEVCCGSEGSNRSLQPTASRRTISLSMTKPLNLQPRSVPLAAAELQSR